MRIQPIFWPGPPRWHSVTQRDVLQRPGGHKGGCFDVRRYLSTHVRLPSPASQSCSNDARGSSCAEQRRYTTRSRSRCRPPEDLPDSEGACSTSSRCEHKRVTDPSLGPPGVFKDGLHGINPNEMHRQALPGPGASGKLVQVPCPVPGARPSFSSSSST